MTLNEKQFIFASLVPRLINKAMELGYTVSLGECYRSPEEALRLSKLGKGIVGSLHTLKLAIDLNLFKDGVYLSDNESHRELGIFWEALSFNESYLTHWGGHFGDGNHYSVGHAGKK